ncbi:DNA methyltransferase [Dickeya dadantii]|uniref:MT-A70 family methyltransferase n=1 Tax=Dickeya dadantii TaxID=204038 RepID=UPI001CF2D9A4|nr:MT-A70 family methyltransferase [Dickeya dadantii]MCA7012500.1 DNA methyltransferase [Dickeya dadantii]
MKKYSLIYADPPWSYSNSVSNGAAINHYGTMSLAELKRLPVWSLAHDDAVLALWYTGTHVEEAIALAKAWGFDVRQMFLFTWVKLIQRAEQRINKALGNECPLDFWDFLDLLNDITRMNGGNYSRQNQESVLLAVRGAGLLRRSASVRQIIYSPLGEHSEKPAETRVRLESLFGDVTRIELFARESVNGWATWGNECHNSTRLNPAYWESAE